MQAGLRISYFNSADLFFCVCYLLKQNNRYMDYPEWHIFIFQQSSITFSALMITIPNVRCHTASLAESNLDQRKQLPPLKLCSPSAAASSVAPAWPSALTWRVSFKFDCHSCISMTWIAPCLQLKGFALFGLQLGSDISDPQSEKQGHKSLY